MIQINEIRKIRDEMKDTTFQPRINPASECIVRNSQINTPKIQLKRFEKQQ